MADLVGIATWHFREGTPAGRIERFARMGFDAVGLWGGDAAALCRGATPDVEEAVLRHSLAVCIHSGFTAGGVAIPVESTLADFESFLAWHSKTGAIHAVNYNPAFVVVGEGEYEYQVGIMRQVLKKALSISNGAGFSVGVEDWPRNAEQLASVADLQGYPHFGVLVDLGHMNITIREDEDPGSPFPSRAAQRYLDGITLPINELHVSNNDGRRDLHAPPMEGNADMRALAELLRRKGVRCVSTIDMSPSHSGLGEEQAWEAAREALEFWREVF